MVERVPNAYGLWPRPFFGAGFVGCTFPVKDRIFRFLGLAKDAFPAPSSAFLLSNAPMLLLSPSLLGAFCTPLGFLLFSTVLRLEVRFALTFSPVVLSLGFALALVGETNLAQCGPLSGLSGSPEMVVVSFDLNDAELSQESFWSIAKECASFSAICCKQVSDPTSTASTTSISLRSFELHSSALGLLFLMSPILGGLRRLLVLVKRGAGEGDGGSVEGHTVWFLEV